MAQGKNDVFGKGIFTNPKLRINTEKMSEIFKYKRRESD